MTQGNRFILSISSNTFSNANTDDIVLYGTSNSQRIVFGTNSGANNNPSLIIGFSNSNNYVTVNDIMYNDTINSKLINASNTFSSNIQTQNLSTSNLTTNLLTGSNIIINDISTSNAFFTNNTACNSFSLIGQAQFFYTSSFEGNSVSISNANVQLLNVSNASMQSNFNNTQYTLHSSNSNIFAINATISNLSNINGILTNAFITNNSIINASVTNLFTCNGNFSNSSNLYLSASNSFVDNLYASNITLINTSITTLSNNNMTVSNANIAQLTNLRSFISTLSNNIHSVSNIFVNNSLNSPLAFISSLSNTNISSSNIVSPLSYITVLSNNVLAASNFFGQNVTVSNLSNVFATITTLTNINTFSSNTAIISLSNQNLAASNIVVNQARINTLSNNLLSSSNISVSGGVTSPFGWITTTRTIDFAASNSILNIATISNLSNVSLVTSNINTRNGILINSPQIGKGISLNTIITSNNPTWIKLATVQDNNTTKGSFKIIGTINCADDLNAIDCTVTVNTLGNNITSVIQHTNANTYSNNLWSIFDLVVVTEQPDKSHLFAKVFSSCNVLINLDVFASTKIGTNTTNAQFYTNLRYGLGFGCNMSSTIDGSLAGTLNNFPVSQCNCKTPFRINELGFIGMNTSNPVFPLELTGNQKILGSLYLFDSNTQSNVYMMYDSSNVMGDFHIFATQESKPLFGYHKQSNCIKLLNNTSNSFLQVGNIDSVSISNQKLAVSNITNSVSIQSPLAFITTLSNSNLACSNATINTLSNTNAFVITLSNSNLACSNATINTLSNTNAFVITLSNSNLACSNATINTLSNTNAFVITLSNSSLATSNINLNGPPNSFMVVGISNAITFKNPQNCESLLYSQPWSLNSPVPGGMFLFAHNCCNIFDSNSRNSNFVGAQFRIDTRGQLVTAGDAMLFQWQAQQSNVNNTLSLMSLDHLGNFRINSNVVIQGNVNIGNVGTFATVPLDVNGNTIIRGSMSIGSTFASAVRPSNSLIIQGPVGIGSSNPSSWTLDIIDSNNAPFYITEYNDGDGAVLRGRRARGTVTVPVALITNDAITALRAFGYNGTSFIGSVGAININAAQNFAPGSNGTYIQFNTTSNSGGGQTERMRIDHDGDVGIGTTNPLYRLDVNGVIAANSNIITYISGGERGYVRTIDLGSEQFLTLFGQNQTSTRRGGFMRVDGRNASIINNNSYDSALFNWVCVNSNGAETYPAALDSSGNFGVSGNIFSTTLTARNGNNGTGSTNNQILFGWNNGIDYRHAIKTRHNGGANDYTNGIDFFIWQILDGITGIGSKNIMSITSAGVGIGTIAPLTSIDVIGDYTIAGQTNVAGRFSANNLDSLLLGSINGNTPFVAASSNTPLHLRTNNNTRIAILQNGNVGIGTTGPGAPLEISARSGSPLASAIMCYNSNASTGQHSIIATRVNGSSGGNPFFSMEISGVLGWSMGIDNSDNDRFKIMSSWDFSGGTRLTIDAFGTVTATTFSGNLSGNVTGNVSGTAGGLSGNPNISTGSINTNNNSISCGSGNVTASTFFGTLSGNVNGNVSGTASGLSGNPNISTGSINTNNNSISCGLGTVTASTFFGNLSGNVNGNVTGTAGGLSGNPNIFTGSINTNNNDISIGNGAINATSGGGTLKFGNIISLGQGASIEWNTLVGLVTNILGGETEFVTSYSASTGAFGGWSFIYKNLDNETMNVAARISRTGDFLLTGTLTTPSITIGSAVNSGLTQLLTCHGKATFNQVTVFSGESEATSGFYFGGGASSIQPYNSTNTISIRCTQWMGAFGYLTISDERIKNNIISSSKSDVTKLLQLRPVTFDCIDKGLDTYQKRGFIAQELKQILPNCVKISTNYIPNIYSLALVLDNIDNFFTIKLQKSDIILNTIKIETMIKIITKNKGTIFLKVKSIDNTNSIIIFNEPQTFEKGDEVFVYGSEVDDFCSIDHDQLLSTSIQTIQFLNERINTQQQQIDSLNEKINKLLETF